jgi:hypothetical protein
MAMARATTARYDIGMGMRRILLAPVVFAGVAGLGRIAAADSFGGFSGVERYYLVGPDRVCAPLAVKAGKATGAPKCDKAAADRISTLEIKNAVPEKGTKARFAATASGRTVTVKATDRDAVLVEWQSFDPVTRVAAVYGSAYGDMIAVEVVVRRAGREATDVVGFDLGLDKPDTPPTTGTGTGTGSGTGTTPTPATGDTPPPPTDPALTEALKKARKATGAKAIAAWTKVLGVDADSSEGLFGLAAAQAKAKKKAEAIATLGKLAASTRTDAIEFRVAARFDKAFASIRSDAAFRKAVGLDQPATTMYERVMGTGGAWEQVQTCGKNPRVLLTLARDHSFKLAVDSKCAGDAYGWTFKGTWQVNASGLELAFPNKALGKTEGTQCSVTAQGDEDSIRCPIDDDLEFVVLPVRR